MKLDNRDSEQRGHLDLGRFGVDEKADGDPGVAQGFYRRFK